MFCTTCGKQLPEGFRYIVCDACFEKRREELLYEGKGLVTEIYATPPFSGNATTAVWGFSGVQGFSGFSGVQGMSGYNFAPETKRAEPPLDAHYIYSDRAKELAKKKLLRKRMIRCTTEGEDMIEKGCPTEEVILNFKGKYIAEMELVSKGLLVNPLKPIGDEKAILEHVKVCESCKKIWDE